MSFPNWHFIARLFVRFVILIFYLSGGCANVCRRGYHASPVISIFTLGPPHFISKDILAIFLYKLLACGGSCRSGPVYRRLIGWRAVTPSAPANQGVPCTLVDQCCSCPAHMRLCFGGASPGALPSVPSSIPSVYVANRRLVRRATMRLDQSKSARCAFRRPREEGFR